MRLLISGMLLVFAAACAEASPEPTPTLHSQDTTLQLSVPIDEPTERASLLPTAVPTSQPTKLPPTRTPTKPAPSPTPDLPLGDGPDWRMELGPEGVLVMNANGTGRELIMPYEPMFTDEDRGYDPWFDYEIARQTGLAAVRISTVSDDLAEPRLLIFELPDLDQMLDLALLRDEDRPQRYDGIYDISGPEMTDDMYMAIHGAGSHWSSMEWSPDGLTLAFVAAIDGSSSDLYLYDTVTSELIRLTDGPNQPKLSSWSPDGEWIVHYEIYDLWSGDGYSYNPLAVWAAASDGSGSILVLEDQVPLSFVSWVSPNRFIAIHHQFMRSNPFDLQVVDLYEGRKQTLYAGTIYSLSIDPTSSTVAFVSYPQPDRAEDTLDLGLYMVSPDQPVPRKIRVPCPWGEGEKCVPGSVEWDEEREVFRLWFGSDRTGSMTLDGRFAFEANK